MTPYIVLGLSRDATQDEIRQRYLELVRAHPPSRDPERFQRIQDAYEAVKTPLARVETYLFGSEAHRSFDDFLADLEGTATPEWKPPGLSVLVEEEGR